MAAWKVLFVLLILAGAGFVILNQLAIHKIYATIIRYQTTLTPGSDPAWHFIHSSDNSQSFYVFSLTNHEDVLNGSKPRVIQLGPYVFNARKSRIDPDWDEDILRYQERVTYQFDPLRSSGTLQDEVITVNPVILEYVRLGLENEIADRSLFFHTTIAQLIRDGFPDPLLNDTLPPIRVPVVNGKAGYFMTGPELSGELSSFPDVEYVVYSGVGNAENLHRIGDIVSFNGSSTLPYYDDRCNELGGSTGSTFPPAEFKPTLREAPVAKESITIFWPQLCKPWTLQRTGKTSTFDRKDFIMDRTNYEATDMFTATGDACLEPKATGEPGTFDASLCYRGFPVILSKPHFYSTKLHIEGLNPSASLHESFVDLYPTSGAVIESAIRMQINLKLTQGPAFELVPSVIYPILWVDIRAMGNAEKTAWGLFWSTEVLRLGLLFGSIVLAASCFVLAGLIMTCGAIRACWIASCKKDHDRPSSWDGSVTYCAEELELDPVAYDGNGVRDQQITNTIP